MTKSGISETSMGANTAPTLKSRLSGLSGLRPPDIFGLVDICRKGFTDPRNIAFYFSNLHLQVIVRFVCLFNPPSKRGYRPTNQGQSQEDKSYGPGEYGKVNFLSFSVFSHVYL